MVSIHPEDLLDKLGRGDLSPAERELLDAHLASCDVCRFELQVGADFRDEARELVLAGSTARSLLGAATREAGPTRRVERRRSRRLVWALAAALLVASTAAVAAVNRGGRSLTALLRWGEIDWQPSLSAAPRAAGAPRATAPSAPASAQVETPVPSALASEAVRTAPAARRAPSAAAAERAEGRGAESLFAAANQARRRGALGEAAGLYRELQRDFPRSQEAELSHVTLSMLLLDRGDAAAALAGFDSYLARSRRPLEAEALVGRARALGALGSSAAEAAAWREVQRKYPGSFYARQAEARLSALGRP